MSTFTTHNPTTGKPLKDYVTLEKNDVLERIEQAHRAFQTWSHTSFSERARVLQTLATLLKERKNELSKQATLEMGKTLTSNVAEVEKCALVCEYCANEGEQLLRNQVINTEAKESYIAFQPLGVIFAVMPWNFPYWQVFRAAAPALMAGNTIILKHSSLVPECGQLIQELFDQASVPAGVFQYLPLSSAESEVVIGHPAVRAVTLTGSEGAGSAVAALAGKYLKKCVLELGGSDPFIVLDDADLHKAVSVAVAARLIANGQSCIAAKRFIVEQKIAPEFTKLFKEALEKIIVGDPLNPQTQLGPLASEQILTTLEQQVKQSVEKGAVLVTGGTRVSPLSSPSSSSSQGYFFAPTLLSEVKKGMAAYDEETFGPVAAVITAKNDEEALQFANDTPYGLGASVWTTNPKRAQLFIDQLQSGCVFINSQVKSDPRLPFGGVKLSGFGRELGEYGIKEFVNVKTVSQEM